MHVTQALFYTSCEITYSQHDKIFISQVSQIGTTNQERNVINKVLDKLFIIVISLTNVSVTMASTCY
jgi:hypothetical protein